MTIGFFRASCLACGLACGLLIRHHRDEKNRSLSCDSARLCHLKTSVKKRTLLSLLAKCTRPYVDYL